MEPKIWGACCQSRKFSISKICPSTITFCILTQIKDQFPRKSMAVNPQALLHWPWTWHVSWRDPLSHTTLNNQCFVEQVWQQSFVQRKGIFIWSITKQCLDLFRALNGKGCRGQSQWSVLLNEQNLDQFLKGPFLRNSNMRWRWYEKLKTDSHWHKES